MDPVTHWEQSDSEIYFSYVILIKKCASPKCSVSIVFFSSRTLICGEHLASCYTSWGGLKDEHILLAQAERPSAAAASPRPAPRRAAMQAASPGGTVKAFIAKLASLGFLHTHRRYAKIFSPRLPGQFMPTLHTQLVPSYCLTADLALFERICPLAFSMPSSALCKPMQRLIQKSSSANEKLLLLVVIALHQDKYFQEKGEPEVMLCKPSSSDKQDLHPSPWARSASHSLNSELFGVARKEQINITCQQPLG